MIVDDRSEIIREELVVAYSSAPNMTAFREMRRRNNVSDRQNSQPVSKYWTVDRPVSVSGTIAQ
jgi:hypothetical protein